MSEKAERERQCADLRAAMTSLAGHQLARAGSNEDFVATVAERPMLDDEQEAELWARSGGVLRAVDPETYKLLSALVASLAAVATAPVEN